MIDFIDTLTGQTGRMPKRLFGKKPFTPADRILVEPGTKPFVPELYRAQDAETFEKNHPKKVAKSRLTEPAMTENEEVDPVEETQPEENDD